MNWSPSLDEPVGGDDVSVATPVADPSSMGGTLTLIGGTLALNGNTAIAALVGGPRSGAGTVKAESQATSALPFTILQAASKRFPSQSHLRGETPCR
jgi:hypothetical protein